MAANKSIENYSFSLAFEKELKVKIDRCLLDLKEQGEEEFNKFLKEQLADIIDAFKDSMPLHENVNPDDIQKFIQKYINVFLQKYKRIEGPSPDKIGKRLATEFKNYFVSLIHDDKAQKEYLQEYSITLTDLDFVAIFDKY